MLPTKSPSPPDATGTMTRPLLTLAQVETVGIWAGLLSAVVSIVLSVVAILFARDVDRRSMEISNQTIRSLESIQSTVQRLSDDTGGLIKVAWERMLGTMGAATAQPDSELQGLLYGLLAEFRQDANDLAPGTGVDRLAREAVSAFAGPRAARVVPSGNLRRRAGRSTRPSRRSRSSPRSPSSCFEPWRADVISRGPSTGN